ncbi:hypothetical protein LJC45_05535 [Alistipes sp. OttesenSCG-928-B03]|nr:hypothetical protein [Alistipes sp. OttesenSCG-928-B03]
MKKHLYFLASLFVVLTSAGCDDGIAPNNGNCDMIWDFAPMELMWRISDTDGNNLLDPDFDGNILDRDIVVKYKYGNDTEHHMQPIAQEPDDATRAYMPYWSGLRVRPVQFTDHTELLLVLGEFVPIENHRGTKLTIDWGDGTSDEVKFDFYVTGTNCDPDVTRRLWVNGEELKNYWIIDVVK